jgi:SAM-dependent methyltransferase
LKRAGRSEGNWRFIQADLDGPFPLPSNHASAVTATQVIEHVADPSHFIVEAHRILRPGGVLVLTTPNIRYIKHIARLVVMGRGPSTSSGEAIDGSWDDGHLHYFTHADLRLLLVKGGFCDVRSQAMIDLGGGRPGRQLLDRFASVGVVREFMSGNALVISRK